MPIREIWEINSKHIEVIENINRIGYEMGISQELVNVGVVIANFESAIDPAVGKVDSNDPNNTAYGLYQYIQSSNRFPQGLKALRRDHNAGKIHLKPEARAELDRLISDPNLAESERISDDGIWQTRVALNEIRGYADGYPEHIYDAFSDRMNELKELGYDPHSNILHYSYLRHNTSPTQTAVKLFEMDKYPDAYDKIEELSVEAGEKYRNSLNTKPLTVKDIVSQYTGSNGKEIAELLEKL